MQLSKNKIDYMATKTKVKCMLIRNNVGPIREVPPVR